MPKGTQTVQGLMSFRGFRWYNRNMASIILDELSGTIQRALQREEK